MYRLEPSSLYAVTFFNVTAERLEDVKSLWALMV